MKGIRAYAPITKFIAMLVVIACAYLTDSLAVLGGLILFQALVAFSSGVGRVYRTTLLALLVGAATLILFQIFGIREGRTIFTLLPPLGWGSVTDVGLRESGLMAVRMIASVGSVPLMVALTPSTQIVSLVSGTFRLSSAYTCMLVTALRFIPTFGERMGMVLQAEASRGYRADTGNPFRRIGMVLRLSLPLLVTCVRDVDALALSLEARGFDPNGTQRPKGIAPSAGEYGVMACALAVAALLLAFRLGVFQGK